MSECPMTKDVPLSECQVNYFCSLGCSVDCPKFLDEFIKKQKTIKEKNDNKS